MDEKQIKQVLDETSQVLGPGTIRQKKVTGEEMTVTWRLEDGQAIITSVCVASETGVGREALQQVARGVHRFVDQQAAATVARVFPTPVDEKSVHRSLTNTRHRRAWTDTELRQAAAVYRSAVVDGLPPRQAVAEHYSVSAAMASKVIRMARDAGFLGEPGKEVGGNGENK